MPAASESAMMRGAELWCGNPLSDKTTVGLYLVNGWNNVEDDNGGKSIGASLNFKPSAKWNFIINGIYGPEGGPTSPAAGFFGGIGFPTAAVLQTGLVDLIAQWTPTGKIKLAANFDYAIVPMGWKQLQPQENVFVTDPVDDWIETLSRKRLPAIAGPLIRLGQDHVPDWMVIWEHDFDMLRELAYEYVQKVVTRYRRGVAVWNVASGISTNSSFTLSFEQIIELTRLLVSQVKTLLPGARTLVTITHPFGEYHARGRSSVAPMLYAEMLANAGINFEAFGVEIEYSPDGPQLLGTAGALRRALPLLDDAFAVVYGDSYLTCNYAAAERVLRMNCASVGTAGSSSVQITALLAGSRVRVIPSETMRASPRGALMEDLGQGA